MIQHHRRVAAATLVALAGAGLLASCAAPAADNGDGGEEAITIAAVYPNTSDPFWQTISCGASARAEELGVDLQQFNSTNTDTNTIASNFQSASLIGADGMIVNSFVPNQFIAQTQQLMADGIPVVSGSQTDPQAEYKAIFSDAETTGFVDELLDAVPEGAGSMVYLGGAPGIPPLESRTLPFFEAMQDARPDLTVLPNDYSGFDINKSTQNVSSLIIANPDLKLIIAAAGPDGVGAAAAIEQAGKAGEITLIAFDAIPPEVDALRNGTITALIAQDPFSIGTRSVDAIVDYLKANPDGGAIEPDGVETIPSFVLTSDNIDDPASAKYIYTTEC
jgi:ribose transport system substrate-binding protein